MDDQRFEARARYGGAPVAADESVGRTCGKAQDKSDEVPTDGAEQAGEKDLLVDEFDVNHAFADGAGNSGAEDERGDEVPEGGPSDSTEGREYARGDYGGDGVGGVVPAV